MIRQGFEFWKKSLPGYTIVPIDIDNSGQNLISNGGGIHCITHAVGVNEPCTSLIKNLETPQTPK